ncbi:hypothetical protein LPJCHP_LPJCHP_12865, partial [Dysosmobacter welbionis]
FRAASCAGPAGLCGDAGPAPVAPPRLCAGVLRRGVRRHSPDLHRHLRRELCPAPAGGRCRTGQGRRSGPGCPAAADGLHPPGSKRRRPPSQR